MKDIPGPEDLDEIRDGLIDRKRRLAERIERFSEESALDNPMELGQISSLPTHQADLGTDAMEQEKTLGMAERSAEEIKEIDEALERIKTGTYGICELCGQRIGAERLRVLPSAPYCRGCQASQEAA